MRERLDVANASTGDHLDLDRAQVRPGDDVAALGYLEAGVASRAVILVGDDDHAARVVPAGERLDRRGEHVDVVRARRVCVEPDRLPPGRSVIEGPLDRRRRVRAESPNDRLPFDTAECDPKAWRLAFLEQILEAGDGIVTELGDGHRDAAHQIGAHTDDLAVDDGVGGRIGAEKVAAEAALERGVAERQADAPSTVPVEVFVGRRSGHDWHCSER